MTPKRTNTGFIVLITAIWAAMIVYILQPINSNHAPLSDDLSMIAFSNEWSWEWLNKGLTDYFVVYPEYFSPQSNFIRPVSNIVYWLFQVVFFPSDTPFFANRIQLLVLTYGMLITFCIVNFVLFLKVQNSFFIATLGMISCIFIPTFWTTPSPTYTSFVFDGLAITLCILTLIVIQNKQFFLMTIGLFLALLTKEIAIPVILGFTLAFLIVRNRKAFGGCLIAIIMFLIIRINGFGAHAEGIYVFDTKTQTFNDYLLEKLRNVLSLPFGPVLFEDIFAPGDVKIGYQSASLLIINLGIYTVILTIITRIFFNSLKYTQKIRELRSKTWDDKNVVLLIAALSALISFIFDIIVGSNYRYAFNFLPFLFIALAGANMRSLAKIGLFVIILFGSLIASSPSIVRLHDHFNFENFRYQSVRSLFDKLRTHGDSKSIVILNDFVLGYANPKAVEIITPMSGRLIRGTSLYLNSCKLEEIGDIITHIEHQRDTAYISVRLPKCGRFAFESAPKLPEFASGNIIRRNNQIRYEFEFNSQVSYANIQGWSGRDLKIMVKDADIVYFDFIQNKWMFLSVVQN